MSNDNTSAVKSVKVISDARMEEMMTIMRQLHGKVLVALQECDIKPLFPDNIEKCGAEDLKNLHQQSRALINAHKQSKWEVRIAEIRGNVNALISTHMERKAKTLATILADGGTKDDFNPHVWLVVSDMVSCWPKGTDMSVIIRDLTDLGFEPGKRTKAADAPMCVKVTYQAPEAVKVAEEAPKSDTQTKAA